MRRGGRMLYGLDVTNVSTPGLLWKFGCPNLGNDTNCVPSSGANPTSIGQTWSTPSVAGAVLGHSSPVIVVGGGYDGCEDSNTPNPACPTPQKGAGVYVLDAQTGQQLAFFTTTRSVAADVALISIATVGVVDHAYAADTGGNIYRIDFAANSAQWVMNRIAYTNGSGRKLLFGASLLAATRRTGACAPSRSCRRCGSSPTERSWRRSRSGRCCRPYRRRRRDRPRRRSRSRSAPRPRRRCAWS